MIDIFDRRAAQLKARGAFVVSAIAGESQYGPDRRPWPHEREQRRERFLALTLLLLEAHEVGYYSERKARAVQRALGVRDEVLAAERQRVCEEMLGGLKPADPVARRDPLGSPDGFPEPRGNA